MKPIFITVAGVSVNALQIASIHPEGRGFPAMVRLSNGEQLQAPSQGAVLAMIEAATPAEIPPKRAPKGKT